MDKQELALKVTSLLDSLSSEYNFDYHIENFKLATGVNLANKNTYIKNTISVYTKHHKDFDYKRVSPLIEEFIKIIKKDKVVFYENDFLYLELYKVLSLIHHTFMAQTLLNSTKDYPSGFSEIQSDIKEVKSFNKHYKNNLIGYRKIIEKGQSRFRRCFTALYIKNRTLTKFYTHMLLTIDLDKVGILNSNDEKDKLLMSELKFFLMQKTSISKVIKSFGILLYFELVKFMNFSIKESEVFANNIVYKLFKENFNTHELNKNIQITSSLGFLPIFSASKKSNLKIEEKEFVKNRLHKEMQGFFSLDTNTFNLFFESFMGSSHIQYLQKYPAELFRTNPKYSS